MKTHPGGGHACFKVIRNWSYIGLADYQFDSIASKSGCFTSRGGWASTPVKLGNNAHSTES